MPYVTSLSPLVNNESKRIVNFNCSNNDSISCIIKSLGIKPPTAQLSTFPTINGYQCVGPVGSYLTTLGGATSACVTSYNNISVCKVDYWNASANIRIQLDNSTVNSEAIPIAPNGTGLGQTFSMSVPNKSVPGTYIIFYFTAACQN